MGELDSLGVEEYIGKDGISVIEWAERLGEPEDCISVILKIVGEEKREIIIGERDEKNRHNL